MSKVSHIDRFDNAVNHFLERFRGNRFFDGLFYFASTIGDFSIIWYFSAVIKAFGPEANQDAAVRLALSLMAESIFINVFVKSFFKRSRPVHDGPRPHRLRIPLTSSFPSGHASSGFMAATLLSDGQIIQMPLWFSLALIVATSRIYVRIHHASDVIGGAIIGTGIGLLIINLWVISS